MRERPRGGASWSTGCDARQIGLDYSGKAVTLTHLLPADDLHASQRLP
jgi:hypothetical protein